MTQADDENQNGVKGKPATLRPLDAAQLAALGGEPLAGSGFEEEEPEAGFSTAGLTLVGKFCSGKRSSLLALVGTEPEKPGITPAGGEPSAGADVEEPGASGPAPDQSPA